MRKNDPRRRKPYRLPEYLAGMRNRTVQAADEDRLFLDDFVLCVQIDSHHVLLLEIAHLFLQQRPGALRRCDRSALQLRGIGYTHPQFNTGLDFDRFGSADSMNSSQFFKRGHLQGMQILELIQHPQRQLHDVAVPGPCPQNDSQ